MSSLFVKRARSISARLSAWRKKRHDLAELYSLDDALLADIGITRADIPYLLDFRTRRRGG